MDTTTNNMVIQLRAIAPISDATAVRDLDLPSNECAQTMSLSTSVDALARRIKSMQSKGFEVTAIAGHDGKFVSAFTRTPDITGMTVIEIADADPGISHNYRLSTNTLHHVAHNGNSWMFAYLNEKLFSSQTVIKCQTIENLLAQIKATWKRNFRITSLTHGNGHWVAVGTQAFDPDEQSYFTATDAESLQEKTKKAWDEGRRIAAIAYGSDKWLVILNKTEEITAQKWLTRRSFVDLRQKIREEWLRGFQVTSVARGSDVWLVVLSKTEI